MRFDSKKYKNAVKFYYNFKEGNKFEKVGSERYSQQKFLYVNIHTRKSSRESLVLLVQEQEQWEENNRVAEETV